MFSKKNKKAPAEAAPVEKVVKSKKANRAKAPAEAAPVEKVAKSKKATKAPAEAAAKSDARKGQPGSHPPHPKCPSCGKAMYKSMTKGKVVKKSDPWAFCRHPACELIGVDQSGTASEENKGGAPTEKAPVEGKKAKGKKAKAPTEKAVDVVEKAPVEKAPVEKAPTEKAAPAAGKGAALEAEIKKHLLPGKLTQVEIAETLGCSRKRVRLVRDALKTEGLL